jgi:hypothetical protein
MLRSLYSSGIRRPLSTDSPAILNSMIHAFLIDRLQQTWPENSMHLYATANDLFG